MTSVKEDALQEGASAPRVHPIFKPLLNAISAPTPQDATELTTEALEEALAALRRAHDEFSIIGNEQLAITMRDAAGLVRAALKSARGE